VAKKHREILARLDSVGLRRYQITEKEVRIVEKYLSIIQEDLKGISAWDDLIGYGGSYGTSILIHEVVELRELEARGLDLRLRGQSQQALRDFLAENIEAHVMALYEEHSYLQEVISRLYGQLFEVATLVKANSNDEQDLQLFLESKVGVYIMEEERVETARQALARLKGEAG
jgi:hypothetical protein